jgi:hypothetical protein
MKWIKWMHWTGLAAAVVLLIACFIPWITVSRFNIVVTGVDSTGTNFGKPGYFHLLLGVFFIMFTLINRIWAKRWNLAVVALNLAWAIRNYFIITACKGDCPEKQTGIYLVLISALLMLAAGLFPYMRPRSRSKEV